MPLSLNWFHHLHLSRKRRQITDQKGLRITAFFRMMAFSMISIFSVVFVFQFGQEYFQSDTLATGLLFLMLYLILLEATVLFAAIPVASRVINKIGYRKSIIFSLLFSAIGFLLLAVTSVWGSLITVLLAPVFLGLGGVTFWITYHVLFVEDVDPDHLGGSYGILEATMRFGQVLAPLIGAGVTVFFGFQVLFILGMLILALAGIPMLFLKHHLHFDRVSYAEFFDWCKELKYLKFGIAAGGRGLDEKMLGQLWPVFVFLVVGTVEGLGVFQSTVIFFTAIFGIVIAKLFDRRSRKLFQAIGVAGGAFFWLIRVHLRSLGVIIFVDSIDRFFTTTSRMFFFGYTFRRARGRQALSFVVYWVFWEALFMTLVYVGLALMIYFFGTTYFWIVVSIIAALGIMATMLVEDHK